jgi:hypothetical protein
MRVDSRSGEVKATHFQITRLLWEERQIGEEIALLEV